MIESDKYGLIADADAVLNQFTNWLKTSAIDECYNTLPSDGEYFILSNKLSNDYTKISYEQYIRFRDEAPPSLKKYMKTMTFLQAARNDRGEVVSSEILMSIQRAIDVERAYLGLMASSRAPNRDTVSEIELGMYIGNLLTDISSIAEVEEAFLPYVIVTSVRKFFFFHDPHNRGIVSIKKLAHTTTMEELLFLHRLDKYEHDLDPKIYREQLGANWFYHKNALYLYSLFSNLDEDRNGTLSVNELMNFTGTSVEPAQFTRSACERIIQVHMSSSRFQELDYNGFVNLVLAIENKASLPSLSYFWKVLDVFDTGRLTQRAIQYFYRDIYDILRRDDYPVAPAAVVTSEIMDILRCNDHDGVSFKEFKASGQANTVASILLDASCFLIYENREAQINNQSNGDDQDSS